MWWLDRNSCFPRNDCRLGAAAGAILRRFPRPGDPDRKVLHPDETEATKENET